MQRKELEEQMLKGIASVLTPQEHQEFAKKLAELSDVEFMQTVSKSIKACRASPLSTAEIKKMERQIQKKRGITVDKSALGEMPASWMTGEEMHLWWDQIRKSRPSDSIFLMGADDTSLCRLWQDGVKDKSFIPSDLFFAGNIPLMDCEITVDERDVNPPEKGGRVCPFRVVIFEDYKERIEREDSQAVGALLIHENQGDVVILLNAMKGLDGLLITGFGIHGNYLKESMQHVTTAHMLQGTYAFLSTWYGIQIALLHPQLREVFHRPKTMPAANGKADSKRRKRQVRYIRRHIIKAGQIEEAMSEPRDYTRHTLAWYVIGHWRHYQDGKKVFIKGYWKGVLRHLKQNLDEGRDRIINVPEGGIQ